MQRGILADILCVPILYVLQGMQLRVPSLSCYILNLQLSMWWNTTVWKLLSVVCFSLSLLSPASSLGFRETLFHECPSSLKRSAAWRPKGPDVGHSPVGTPFAQTVYEIVNQAAKGRRSGGRGEGELIPPPSLSQSLLLSKLKCSWNLTPGLHAQWDVGMPLQCTDFLCSSESQSRAEAQERSHSIRQWVPHHCAACARGSSMVLRLLLLLGGLLRATKPAPRCETGQETLGKANHPKSPPSSLLPSPGDKLRVPAPRRGKQELSLSPRDEEDQLFGSRHTAGGKTGVVLGKHGWEGGRCVAVQQKNKAVM